MLTRNRLLLGERLTEPDIRLFTSSIRSDEVYVSLFKFNRPRAADYRALPDYVLYINQLPGSSRTIDFEHSHQHYNVNLTMIKPTSIVPIGPDRYLLALPGRERVREAQIGVGVTS